MMLQIVVQCPLNSWFNSYLDLNVSHRQLYFRNIFHGLNFLLFSLLNLQYSKYIVNFGAFRYFEMTHKVENDITSHISTFKINMPIFTFILLQFWNLLKCSHPLCVINCNSIWHVNHFINKYRTNTDVQHSPILYKTYGF